MSAIRRDFLPSDLEKDIREAGIDGVVSVQARQTREETHWLLDTVAQNDKAPLTEPSVRDELDLLRGDPRFRAIRHVVQGEPDGYLVRSYFNAGVSVLQEMGLTYGPTHPGTSTARSDLLCGSTPAARARPPGQTAG